MVNAIDAAVAQAEQQAKAAVPAAVAPASQGGAVATVIPQGRKITADDTVGGSMNVDDFLKFTDMGTIVLKGKQFDELHVTLDLSEIGFGWAVRYGDPVSYERTTDMVTSDKGGSWEDAVARAARFNAKNRPYNSWELPFTLLADYGEMKTGDRVGYTTVWSSYKAFRPVYDKARAQFGDHAVIELKIKCKGVNQPGKKYGQAEFELIAEVGGDE